MGFCALKKKVANALPFFSTQTQPIVMQPGKLFLDPLMIPRTLLQLVVEFSVAVVDCYNEVSEFHSSQGTVHSFPFLLFSLGASSVSKHSEIMPLPTISS